VRVDRDTCDGAPLYKGQQVLAATVMLDQYTVEYSTAPCGCVSQRVGGPSLGFAGRPISNQQARMSLTKLSSRPCPERYDKDSTVPADSGAALVLTQ